ncbi:MAG: hypothetical protein WC813_04895 [Patescibacteria group bacterium]|jgi:hypothetical protein
MQPVHTHQEARPGIPLIPGKRFFSPETGTILCPDNVSKYLRQENVFTPDEIRELGTAPPAKLMVKATRKTLIVPLPGTSIKEMAAKFMPDWPPSFKMHADHLSQAWVHERAPARWVRLELAHRLHWHLVPLESDEQVPTAREQVGLMLICHEDPDLPNFMEAAVRHATSTKAEDRFAISVRLYQKEFRFLNVSDHRLSDLSAVIIRSSVV